MQKVSLIFIAISLSVTFYLFSEQAVYRGTGKYFEYKVTAFTCISEGGMKAYKKKMQVPYRGRLFSNLLANGFMNSFGDLRSMSIKNFSSRVAFYNTFWFAAVLVLIIIFSKNPLIFILGLSACSAYMWTPAAENLIYPWDGPMPFFWTTILLLSTSRHKTFLPLVAGLAMGFKETIILSSIIPIFWQDKNLNYRLKFAVFTLLVCLFVKFCLDLIVGNPVPIFTMWTHYPGHACISGHYWLIDKNIYLFFSNNINNPIFAAGGLIIAIFTWPKIPMLYKSLALAYLPFMMIFCVISEARLFNEMIPMFFVGLEKSKWQE